ncbi:MAG: alpha/beta hydrolase [Bacteroidetes bacterium]|nr:alpha/beta hydrolase [Fibrella sp.]
MSPRQLRFRWRYVAFLLTAMTGLLPQCVSIRMSDKAVTAYFSDAPVKPTFHTLPTGGRVIHYASLEAADSLPVVVFVHGSPGSWDAFIAYFKDSTLYKRARLISVDRLGFGKSGLGRTEASLQKQAAALAAVINHVTLSGRAPLRRAVVVGHSLGGPVIARLAMDFPDRVSHLVLVAPSIDPELEQQEWFRPVLGAFPLRQLLPTELDVSNREIRPLRGELLKMMPLWATIRVPVTVIQGDQDNLVPPGNAVFANRMLVNAPVTLRMLPGMNHFIPWRRADTIHDAILNALAAPLNN